MGERSIMQLHQAGVCVTINSDDPPMFDCETTDDFKAVADTFNLATEDITQIARNGFEASFLEPQEKAKVLAEFDQAAREAEKAPS
jgi:adenosine deaminase